MKNNKIDYRGERAVARKPYLTKTLRLTLNLSLVITEDS